MKYRHIAAVAAAGAAGLAALHDLTVPRSNFSGSQTAESRVEPGSSEVSVTGSQEVSHHDLRQSTLPKEIVVCETVKTGDTLSGIAQRLQRQGVAVSWEEIARQNDIQGPDYTIYPGDTLRVQVRDLVSDGTSETSPLPRHELSPALIEHVKNSEGFRETAYLCAGNCCTIGWGHTDSVIPGSTITREQAERYLHQDLARAEHLVRRHVEVPLTRGQYEALVDMAFNLGEQLFVDRQGRETNTLQAINSLVATDRESYEQSLSAVVSHIQMWTRAGGKVQPGLVTRRAANIRMFSSSFEEYSNPYSP